ncbi:MAG TPA: helix-turn-helix transcriptional regulator [Campylobacterales bacterium]|nr:helix-turn-helix transcriptional regulator [Campylobacterales bacterium]
MHSFEDPVYQISIVAELLGIHPQTLRHYEREGLVVPSRTNGKIRVYSQKDIDDLKLILRLTRELGVNLAGVDVVLQLKNQVRELQKEIDLLRRDKNALETESIVPKNRQVVIKKSSYKVILFETNKGLI